MMDRSEAARLLIQMLAELRDAKGRWMNDDYYKAVSTACGVLLVDDVLNSNCKQVSEEYQCE